MDGVASGVQALGLNTMDLAIRYLLVGLVMNFVGGWVTDFTTAYVSKQQRYHTQQDTLIERGYSYDIQKA